ncbi:hypothetical protein [Sphingomonas abietis]|uniref:Uncharacterized protein n=1 Tax=Sphingomonas abietis TaxID=3012344 RepID=A0ABY7NN22_9SPHN|nr:hypothetical protein [Sphingomonas abietis]WBO22743.1 hypothetical protein PBT88_00900 [Sphingomonas abietis]
MLIQELTRSARRSDGRTIAAFSPMASPLISIIEILPATTASQAWTSEILAT